MSPCKASCGLCQAPIKYQEPSICLCLSSERPPDSQGHGHICPAAPRAGGGRAGGELPVSTKPDTKGCYSRSLSALWVALAGDPPRALPRPRLSFSFLSTHFFLQSQIRHGVSLWAQETQMNQTAFRLPSRSWRPGSVGLTAPHSILSCGAPVIEPKATEPGGERSVSLMGQDREVLGQMTRPPFWP